jgi:hypothetical protein
MKAWNTLTQSIAEATAPTESMKMSRYKVRIDDNFHFEEEDERVEYGTFSTADEALDACRRLVDESLLAEYKDGETADELYERYTSFGDDPFVVALDGSPKVEFSAWTYARQRAQQFTGLGQEGAQLRRAVLDRKHRLRKR